MADPKGILFFLDDLDAVEPLTFEERGRLFTSLLRYAKGDDALELEGNEKFLFPMFRARIDRDFEKYHDRCEKNSENAKKRKQANASERKQSQANANDCERNQPIIKEEESKDKDKSKKEEEKETQSKEEAIISHTPEAHEERREHFDYEPFRAIYNKFCTELPYCRTLTEKRKKAIKTFSRDFSIEQWEEICQIANESSFLIGDNDRGWKADIDFLLKPDKAARALEGGYKNAARQKESFNPFMEMLREEEERKNGQSGNAENYVTV